MTAEHAPLPPSGADQWGPGGCAASVMMQRLYPEDEENEAAREGVAAHFYVAETLLGRQPRVGTTAPNDHPITNDMADDGAAFIRDVTDTVRAASPGSLFQVETRVWAAALVHPDNWGTPDVLLIDFARRTVFVWDYKYGHGYVDEWKTWQTRNYVVAALETHNVHIDKWPEWTVVITIGQPRYYGAEPVRDFKTSGKAAVGWAKELREAARLATSDAPPFKTGDHCDHCTARHNCEALQRLGGRLVDASTQSHPVELTNDALGREMAFIATAIERLEARLTGLQARAESIIRHGGQVPLWAWKQGQGREIWTWPVNEVIAMAGSIDISKPAALTPRQARKAGMDETLVSMLSERKPGTFKLERADPDAANKALGGPPA